MSVWSLLCINLRPAHFYSCIILLIPLMLSSSWEAVKGFQWLSKIGPHSLLIGLQTKHLHVLPMGCTAKCTCKRTLRRYCWTTSWMSFWWLLLDSISPSVLVVKLLNVNVYISCGFKNMLWYPLATNAPYRAQEKLQISHARSCLILCCLSMAKVPAFGKFAWHFFQHL